MPFERCGLPRSCHQERSSALTLWYPFYMLCTLSQIQHFSFASPSFPGAQDYSLLRGEGTADVFPSDVETGKKRPASALRLLALAKEEALVHPVIAVHASLRCAPQLLAIQ